MCQVYANLFVKLIIATILCAWGIGLATGSLSPNILHWLVWFVVIILNIVLPTDFGFSEHGIVVEKYGRLIFIPCDAVCCYIVTFAAIIT
jgi:low temperature requirement protein LtrA